jgi:hypothetical protein
MASLERKLKEKSDQIIENRIRREIDTQEHILKEKYRFKKEVIIRETIQISTQNENQ